MRLTQPATERSIAPRSVESGIRTRGVILGVAERLFAAKGFDGVSMREIGLAADVPIALVSHHFKSKLGLYRAVFRAHGDTLTEYRMAVLRDFRPSSDPRDTVRRLARVLVEPVIRMTGESGGRDFARLIARETNDPQEQERGVLAEFIDPVARLMVERLQDAFPKIDKSCVFRAFLFASGALAINHAATGRIERLSGGLCSSSQSEAIVEQLTDFITGGILATFAAAEASERVGSELDAPRR
jgi:AcrR family transcriptional regulator